MTTKHHYITKTRLLHFAGLTVTLNNYKMPKLLDERVMHICTHCVLTELFIYLAISTQQKYRSYVALLTIQGKEACIPCIVN